MTDTERASNGYGQRTDGHRRHRPDARASTGDRSDGDAGSRTERRPDRWAAAARSRESGGLARDDDGTGSGRVHRRQGPRRSESDRGGASARSPGTTAKRDSNRRRTRVPFGVKALCGLLVLSGLSSLFAAQTVATVNESAGTLLTLLGLGYLAVTYGLWTLRWWGWYVGIGLFGLGLVISLGAGLVPGLVLNAGLLGYLWIRRRVFLSPRPGTGTGARRSSSVRR